MAILSTNLHIHKNPFIASEIVDNGPATGQRMSLVNEKKNPSDTCENTH